MQLYSLFAMYGFTAIVLMIFGTRLAYGLSPRKFRILKIGSAEYMHCLDAVFLISGIAFIWIARLPILQFGQTINPDETQLSAKAMRLWTGVMNPANWSIGTSGKLNSAILAWPYLMGLDITLTTTRMMGTAIICTMLVMLFLAIRCLATTEIAVLCSFPLFIFYGSTINPDFFSYSSELLPLLFISIGIYGFFRSIGTQPAEKGQLGIFVLSALSLGLVPYAKMQAAPLAALVGIALIAVAFYLPDKRRPKWKLALSVICAASAPSLMVLFLLLSRGEFFHFVTHYILYIMKYVGNPLSMERFFYLVHINNIYWTVFWLYAAVSGISLILCCFFRNSITAAQKWMAWLSILSVPTAWFCIARSGHEFLHYLQFMLLPLALAAGVLMSTLSDTFRVRMKSMRLHGVMHLLLCSAMIILIIPTARTEINNNLANLFPFLEDGLTFKSPRILQWLGIKNTDSVLVWGWMPQWYLSTGMKPAGRDSTNNKQIIPSPLTGYFRDQLIQDLNRSRPDFIIDAVSPGNYMFDDPNTQSISSFPALAEMIQDQFVTVTHSVCQRLYVRKERFAGILKNLIRITGISASGQYDENTGAGHVNDGYVFEPVELSWDQSRVGACIGFWLLPDDSTGQITLEFDNSRVGSVSILNTRGSTGDRASERVRILVLLGETVLHQHELKLSRYPFWTHYKLPQPVDAADHVRIEILSFIGKGAGLNEIKIYREEPEIVE